MVVGLGYFLIMLLVFIFISYVNHLGDKNNVNNVNDVFKPVIKFERDNNRLVLYVLG